MKIKTADTNLNLIPITESLPNRDCQVLVKKSNGAYGLCYFCYDGETSPDLYLKEENIIGKFYNRYQYQGIDYVVQEDVVEWCELLFWGIDLAEV